MSDRCSAARRLAHARRAARGQLGWSVPRRLGAHGTPPARRSPSRPPAIICFWRPRSMSGRCARRCSNATPRAGRDLSRRSWPGCTAPRTPAIRTACCRRSSKNPPRSHASSVWPRAKSRPDLQRLLGDRGKPRPAACARRHRTDLGSGQPADAPIRSTALPASPLCPGMSCATCRRPWSRVPTARPPRCDCSPPARGRTAGSRPTTAPTAYSSMMRLLAQGDYSGPAGARRVMREPRCEAAVLETARGGILRRGIAVSQCRYGGRDHQRQLGSFRRVRHR